jgi:hypothetical protein
VFELLIGVGRSATPEYKPGIYELGERSFSFLFWQSRNCCDQLVGESPSNCRANLRHVLPGGQTIQSGEERRPAATSVSRAAA